MVPSLNLRVLIFPRSAPLYCDVIVTFSDQQAVNIQCVVIIEIGTCFNMETLKSKSSKPKLRIFSLKFILL